MNTTQEPRASAMLGPAVRWAQKEIPARRERQRCEGGGILEDRCVSTSITVRFIAAAMPPVTDSH